MLALAPPPGPSSPVSPVLGRLFPPLDSPPLELLAEVPGRVPKSSPPVKKFASFLATSPLPQWLLRRLES